MPWHSLQATESVHARDLTSHKDSALHKNVQALILSEAYSCPNTAKCHLQSTSCPDGHVHLQNQLRVRTVNGKESEQVLYCQGIMPASNGDSITLLHALNSFLEDWTRARHGRMHQLTGKTWASLFESLILLIK